MTATHSTKSLILIITSLLLATIQALALESAPQDRTLNCNDQWRNGRLASFCEMREQTIPAVRGTLSVDGRMNGGIEIKGWGRNEILIRAQVQTSASTDPEARDLAKQIRIETGGGQIRAEGPSQKQDQNWSVSYEIFIPRQSDLSLKTHNGGISIVEVSGHIDFSALNGGVSLKRLGGNVKGSTTNGGLSIDLTGTRWEGEGLDVRTTNGGVSMSVPENYSAQLETGTVNGGLDIGFPVTVQGELNKELSVTLGSGGPVIRAMTTNGGVRVHRKS
jgi:putative adhesin